jgi:polysaccharide pyruvyl transferase WcaK-like protein
LPQWQSNCMPSDLVARIAAHAPAEPRVGTEPIEGRVVRVLIVGGDLDGNLGDRSLIAGMCDDLRSAGRPVELRVPTSRAGGPAGGDLGAVPLRRGARGLGSLLRAASRSDLLLWGGGGLLQDDDSLVKVPYWTSLLALLGPLSRCTVAYALGVGPLRHRASRWLARRALGRCDVISARDRYGQALATELCSLPVTLVPDPALLLRPAPSRAAREWLRDRRVPLDGRPIVGVALRRWFPPRDRVVPHRLRSRFASSPEAAAPQAGKLIDHVARALSGIAEDLGGAHLLFLPTYAIAAEGDVEICHRVLAKTGTPGQVEVIRDPRLYAAVVRELQLMVGGRMHAAILAASAGTPFAGIGYNPKFDGFFELLEAADLLVPVQRVVEDGGAEALLGVLRAALDAGPPSPERVELLRERTRQFDRDLLERVA